MNVRDRVKQEAECAAAAAFDAGALAVLRAVFNNEPLGVAGLTAANLTDDDMERVRWLRQKVWGKRARDYEPSRRRPTGNAFAGVRIANKQDALAARRAA